MKDDALAYAARGWSIIPLVPRAKTPLTPHGLLEASRAQDVIHAWWDRWPDANIGIATGSVSGIVVVDIDPRHGGDESIRTVALPPTLECLTGGGGRHIYFAHPGRLVRNAAGVIGLTGVDLRGDGGYVVAPPSIHESGRRYEWEITTEHLPLAPLPAMFVQVTTTEFASPIGETIPHGQRDATLTSLAGSMRRRGMGADEIEAALAAVNLRCDPPLPPSAIHRIAWSVGRYAPQKQDAVGGILL